MEYKTKNIFPKKSHAEYGGETSPRPLLQNWAYLWINNLKFYSLFLLCV